MAASYVPQVDFMCVPVDLTSSVAVDGTAKTYTRVSGSWITDGFTVGDTITMAGYTNGGNNTTVTITTLLPLVLTCAGATGLVTETSASRTWTSSAQIKDWVGKIEALLTASGWVQTSDTGQTAASALTYPTAVNQMRGYQIWRMADSLQSTVPVFVKFEFGNGANIQSPNIWFTIGTGSNGAGVITGTLLARTADSNITATVLGIFAGSGDTGRLAFFVGGNGSGHVLFSIERTKDAAGADTSDGLLVVVDVGPVASAVQHFRLLRFAGTAPPNALVWGVSVPNGTTYACGANVGVSPVRFFDGMPTNPSLSFMAYLNGDIAALSSVSVSVYGTSHTYFTIGSTHISTLGTPNGNATLMIRYE